MSTCKDCKWWGAAHESECDAPQSDILSRVIPGQYRRTLSVKDAAGFTIHATAADDTNLEARFMTGPDFGCLKFQPKTATA